MRVRGSVAIDIAMAKQRSAVWSVDPKAFERAFGAM